MAANYPDNAPALASRTDSSPATPSSHAADHTDERNEINAIGADLVTAMGTEASLADKIDAMDTATAARELIANKGAANGYASLDGTTKVPIAQIPSGTDASKLQGRDVASTAPTDGYGLVWDNANSQWKPAAISATSNATQLQGRALASTAPSDGQAIVWDNAGSTWKPGTVSGSGTDRLILRMDYYDTAAVRTGVVRVPVPIACTVVRVDVMANTAPTGADLIVDVNYDGTSLWSSSANQPKITAGSNSGNKTTFTTTSLAAGHYLTFDIDQVGSTIAGANVSISVLVTVP